MSSYVDVVGISLIGRLDVNMPSCPFAWNVSTFLQHAIGNISSVMRKCLELLLIKSHFLEFAYKHVAAHKRS